MNRFFSFLVFACSFFIFFSCQKDFSTENGALLAAHGSLLDSNGNCLPDSVYGTFYNGITPGKDTAFVEIQVNVTQTGSYNIETDLQDGIKFIDSGFFSNTGLNIVRLKPIGAPIIPGPFTFTFSFDTTFCSVDITVQDSTGTGLGGNQDDTTGTGGGDTSLAQSGNWQFNQGSSLYKGTIDSATNDVLSGVTFLYLSGASVTGDTAMSLRFLIAAPTIQPGTYTTLSNGIFFSVVKVSSFKILFSADGITPGSDLTIKVTSYNSTTHEMKATFSGNADNGSGSIVPLTNGSITAVFP